MTRILAVAFLMALSIDHGHCQTFEVASITPCKPGTPPPPQEHATIVQYTWPGGRFHANKTTLISLLEWAYSIQPAQHSDGPSWIGTDRYDIEAKAAGRTPDAEMKRMVQALLEDRFQLRMHRESRKMGVLVMATGKGPVKLLPPMEGEAQSIRATPRQDPDQKSTSWRVVATRFPIAQLIDTLAGQLGRVIVNETGLNGEYDFTLELTPDDSQPSPMDASLLITAMRQQLGLTFESRNASVDFVVIDSAQKVVAGN